MKSITVLLSILIVLSIWSLSVCAISPEAAKAILAQTESQANSAPGASAPESQMQISPELKKEVISSPTTPAPGSQMLLSPETRQIIKKAVADQITSGQSGSTTDSQSYPDIDFDHYMVNYFNNSRPEIYCFTGDQVVGYIDFYPDGSSPVPDPFETGRPVHVSYPFSQFGDVMDMLRYTNGSLSLHFGTHRGLLTVLQQVGGA